MAICPDEVGIFRPGRRGQSAAEDTVSLPVSRPAEGPIWAAAVDAFSTWLIQAREPRVRVDILLSNRFARFACVPWSADIADDSEARTVAIMTLESHYGDMSGWTVSLDVARWGEARLACAIDGALLAALTAAVEAAGMTCPLVTPYFIACWNRWHDEFAGGDAILAVAEPQGPVVFATLRAGRWHSVRAVGGAPDAGSLGQLVDRETVFQGFENAPARWMHCPGVDVTAGKLESTIVLAAGRVAPSVAVSMALVGGGA